MKRFNPGKLYRAHRSFFAKPENYYTFSLLLAELTKVNEGDILLFVRHRKQFFKGYVMEEDAIFLHKNQLVIPIDDIEDPFELLLQEI